MYISKYLLRNLSKKDYEFLKLKLMNKKQQENQEKQLNMEKEKNIIETLANIGVPKETTLEIMEELLFNSSKYADNQDAIDTMLQEKLGIDFYIALTQYKNLNK